MAEQEQILTTQDIALMCGTGQSWVRKITRRIGVGRKVGGTDRRATWIFTPAEAQAVQDEITASGLRWNHAAHTGKNNDGDVV